VVVREWDPAKASTEQIESIVEALNEILASDLPADPRWHVTGMREYLTETMPGERRVCWFTDGTDGAADTGAAEPIGHASIVLFGDIGVVEVLTRPTARRQGIGRALVTAAARRAYEDGVSSLGVEAIGGTPAVKFWESLGFRCAYVEMRSVLELASIQRPVLQAMAGAVPAGYRVEYHPGGLPASLLESYAAAKASRGEPGDLELRPSSYDAQRLADSLTTLNRRGMKPYLVLAVHEQSGEVAALTELVVPTQHPTRADQYDTTVVLEHDGYGLARAIKARMLLELRGAETQLREVQTWHAVEREQLQQVNKELGFRPDREWLEYEIDAGDLAERLG
jgi:GNAT superfamily N-acetyltransferase